MSTNSELVSNAMTNQKGCCIFSISRRRRSHERRQTVVAYYGAGGQSCNAGYAPCTSTACALRTYSAGKPVDERLRCPTFRLKLICLDTLCSTRTLFFATNDWQFSQARCMAFAPVKMHGTACRIRDRRSLLCVTVEPCAVSKSC